MHWSTPRLVTARSVAISCIPSSPKRPILTTTTPPASSGAYSAEAATTSSAWPTTTLSAWAASLEPCRRTSQQSPRARPRRSSPRRDTARQSLQVSHQPSHQRVPRRIVPDEGDQPVPKIMNFTQCHPISNGVDPETPPSRFLLVHASKDLSWHGHLKPHCPVPSRSQARSEGIGAFGCLLYAPLTPPQGGDGHSSCGGAASRPPRTGSGCCRAPGVGLRKHMPAWGSVSSSGLELVKGLQCLRPRAILRNLSQTCCIG